MREAETEVTMCQEMPRILPVILEAKRKVWAKVFPRTFHRA